MLTTIAVAAATAFLTSLGAFILAQQRMRREFRLQYKAETVAREILSHPVWKWRTFKIIKHHLGGFEDNELRKLLVQAGAVRFENTLGEEIWGLYSRVGKQLRKDRYPLIGRAFSVIDDVVIPQVSRTIIWAQLAAGDRAKALETISKVTNLGIPEASIILDRDFVK